MSEQPQIEAINAADKICNWIQSDDEPIEHEERMTCAGFIQAAINAALSPHSEQAQEQWTGEFVAGLLYAESIESGIGDIVAAHNASLADAKMLGYQIRKGEILDLQAQLAAERKEKERWQDEYARKVSEHENTKGICDVLNEQVKVLAYLIGECRFKLDWSVTDGRFIQLIDDALEKVKEEKHGAS